MSCIVALKNGSDIYFACETQNTDTRAHFKTNPKWVKFQNSILGVTGDSYVRTLIEVECRFISTEVTRKDVLDYSLLLHEIIPKNLNFSILIGGNGNLFRINDTFEVIEIKEYDSIGSGQRMAIGSLFSTTGLPGSRVEMAVRAAIAYDPACGGDVLTDKI